MFKLVNLSKNYISKNKINHNILKNISLDLPNKGLIFLLGKSGSGKTTLLNLLGCIDNLDSGDILIHNNSVRHFKDVDYDNYRNGNVGFVFQDYNLISDLTVGQNIALSLQLQGKKAESSLINETLKNVDLEGYDDRLINELSGGQKQRVAIARTFIKDTNIILCDEPTGNLDSETTKNILTFLKKMSDDKLILVVTHDIENAFLYGDRVIELKDGQIISDLSKDPTLKNKKPQSKLNSLKGQVVTEELLKQIVENNQSNYKQMFITTPKQQLTSEIKPLTKIKSHLPIPLAFKMGTSLFKKKKIYLFLTILFSVFLFNLFDFIYESVLVIYFTFTNIKKTSPQMFPLIAEMEKELILVIKSMSFLLLFILIISLFLIGGFVKNTIKLKKKDIGVLRSLGARKIDIFKIFFTEGFVISFLITLCLGIILVLPFPLIHWSYFLHKKETFAKYMAKMIENKEEVKIIIEEAFKQFNFWSNLFILLPLLFIISLIITFLSIFLPINRFAKKKVIEIILDK